MSAAVQLDRVTRRYPASPPVDALRDVSLTIDYGEMVAIAGPSGSGKSTMLHLIGTLDQPTTGAVVIDGYNVAALSDRERSALRAHRIGFVFQQFFLAPGTSALDNVADGLFYTGLPRGDRRDRAAAILDRVGLGHRLGHRPHQLSGGEQQRVAIARAAVGAPALLLADEPTGNLDSTSGAAVTDVLEALNDTGATVVIITHEHDIAGRLPRRVLLRDGAIVSDSAGQPDTPAVMST